MEAYKNFRSCSVNKWITNNGNDNPSGSLNTLPVITAMSCSLEWTVTQAKPNRGSIWTDYKFWSDDNNLWQMLSNVFFLDLGIEKEVMGYGYDPLESCYAVGLLLRPCNREIDGLPIYERIGWLRFETGKLRNEWKPEGAITQILIE